MSGISRRTFLRIGGGLACFGPVMSYASQLEPERRLRIGTAWPLHGNLLGLSSRRLAQRIRWRTGGALVIDLTDTSAASLPSLDDIGSAPLDGWHASAHMWPEAPPVWPLFGMHMFGMTPHELRVWRNTSPGMNLRDELARQAGLAAWFTGDIGAGGVLVADGVWSTSGRMACAPGSAPLWESVGFDVVTAEPVLGFPALTGGKAIAAEVPPLLAGSVRRLANAGLGYARFGGFTPGLATELLVKTDVVARLPASQAAAVAEACAEEAEVFKTEAAQEEALWFDALAQAGLLVDVPAEVVHEAEKAASDILGTMASDGPSGIVVDAYRKMRRDLGVTAARHVGRNIKFG
jgi:TRAP-type mannitol/chloroaromatic compound transport system substrate-binding protein